MDGAVKYNRAESVAGLEDSLGPRDQVAHIPPLTGRTAPVTKDASGETIHAMARATSSADAARPIGTRLATWLIDLSHVWVD